MRVITCRDLSLECDHVIVEHSSEKVAKLMREHVLSFHFIDLPRLAFLFNPDLGKTIKQRVRSL
jgi:predicted small metal-binding protein